MQHYVIAYSVILQLTVLHNYFKYRSAFDEDNDWSISLLYRAMPMLRRAQLFTDYNTIAARLL